MPPGRDAARDMNEPGPIKSVYRPAKECSARDWKGNVGPHLARALQSARHERPARRSSPCAGADGASGTPRRKPASSPQSRAGSAARRLRESATTEHVYSRAQVVASEPTQAA